MLKASETMGVDITTYQLVLNWCRISGISDSTGAGFRNHPPIHSRFLEGEGTIGP